MVKDAPHPLKSYLDEIQRLINSPDCDENLFKPLIKAAFVDQHDDTIFWTSLLEIGRLPKEVPFPSSLVTPSTSVRTPPRAPSMRLFDTPHTYDSTSYKGSEQTQQNLDGALFREFENNVYRTVEKYDEKFFQEKEWSIRAGDVFEAMKTTQYINDQWADLGGASISQDRMLAWLFAMQDQRLSNEKCRYYTINLPNELIGGDRQRQIDLILKRKKGNNLSDTEHDWKDIIVIGELKASTNQGVKRPFLQIARYARDIFAAQPLRPFLHAFTICGCYMETHLFFRSGSLSPGPFNIHKNPERFIRTLAGYMMLSDNDLGLDTFLQRDDVSSFITLKGPSGEMKFRLDSDPITYRKAIVGRATTVFRSKTASDSWDCVTKFSWPPAKLQSESDLLKLANERGVEGIPKLLAACDITSVEELCSGLDLGKRYSFKRGGSSAKKRKLQFGDAPSSKRSRSGNRQDNTPSFDEYISQSSYYDSQSSVFDGTISQSSPAANANQLNKRIFRCIVTSPIGKPIYMFSSLLELIIGLRDGIRAHRSLLIKGQILHRDVSENNIIIVNPEDNEFGYRGMLIDFDLAHEMNGQPTGARSRTGTMEFMAIGVLMNDPHTFRHDLESFFYVLLWQCLRADPQNSTRGGKDQLPKQEFSLQRWYQGTFRNARDAKVTDMMLLFKRDILPSFLERFDPLKPLCEDLWTILFQQSFGLYTPAKENDLYDPIIEAFDKAISDLTPSES